MPMKTVSLGMTSVVPNFSRERGFYTHVRWQSLTLIGAGEVIRMGRGVEAEVIKYKKLANADCKFY